MLPLLQLQPLVGVLLQLQRLLHQVSVVFCFAPAVWSVSAFASALPVHCQLVSLPTV